MHYFPIAGIIPKDTNDCSMSTKVADKGMGKLFNYVLVLVLVFVHCNQFSCQVSLCKS